MKIIKIILASLILLLIGIRALSINIEEARPVFKEIGFLCSIFNTYCTVSDVVDNHLLAQTQFGGRIIVSSGLIGKLNVNQLRAVLYHEAGHAVFKHPEKTYRYYIDCMPDKCNETIYNSMRRQFELQADRFSALVLKYTNQDEGLSEALLIVTPIDQVNVTHPSHPSTMERIERIRRIYYGQ